MANVTGILEKSLAAYPVEKVKISVTAAGSGRTTVEAGRAGKILRVTALIFTVSADLDIGWDSNDVEQVPPMPFKARGGMEAEWSRGFIFESAVGQNIQVNHSAAGNIRGVLNLIAYPG